MDLLVYPDTLPTLEQLSFLRIKQNLTKEQIMKKVDGRIQFVKEGLTRLANFDDLRPRQQESSDVLRELKNLRDNSPRRPRAKSR
jgi:hypothetical protein